MSKQITDLCVGSRVYYPGNMANVESSGTVVEVIGTISGKAPKALGGGIVMVTDSCPRANIKVVLDDGRPLTVDELSFSGLRPWKILDEDVVDDEAVAQAVARGEIHKARVNAEKAAQDEAYEAERERLIKDYPQLVRAADDLNAAQKNMRRLLKAEVPHLKLSVRRRHHTSIDVNLTAGEASDEDKQRIKGICHRFTGGHFDGMTDSYSYKRSPWTDLFGSAKYVFWHF